MYLKVIICKLDLKRGTKEILINILNYFTLKYKKIREGIAFFCLISPKHCFGL